MQKLSLDNSPGDIGFRLKYLSGLQSFPLPYTTRTQPDAQGSTPKDLAFEL